MRQFRLSLFVILPVSWLIGAAFAQDTTSGHRIPEDFPEIRIDVVREPAPGFLYLSNFRRRGAEDEIKPYLMILDQAGSPVFFQPVPPLRAFNFTRINNGNLYYYLLESAGLGGGASMNGIHRILDDEGHIVREIRAQGADLPTQAHDFLQLGNGNVLVISQPTRVMDLTEFGGHAESIVAELVIQEMTPEDAVVFEWRSWEHVDIKQTARPEQLTIEPPDAVGYLHGNALALDLDGNIILSARRFDELIKIDRETGAIIWHMGGGNSQNNQFTFIDDPKNGFSGQHHPTILPNGNLLLFDNGDMHEERISRAVEYAIDQENRTARLIWSYDDGRYSGTMGSVQRLANGNTLIGWGSAPPSGPSVTEITPDGEIAFALSLPPTQMSYRAYRFE